MTWQDGDASTHQARRVDALELRREIVHRREIAQERAAATLKVDASREHAQRRCDHLHAAMLDHLRLVLDCAGSEVRQDLDSEVLEVLRLLVCRIGVPFHGCNQARQEALAQEPGLCRLGRHVQCVVIVRIGVVEVERTAKIVTYVASKRRRAPRE